MVRRITRAVFQRLGVEGGKERAKKLTKQRRSDIAKRAAEARWNKQNGKSR